MQVTAILTSAEEGGYVAYNAQTGATSQGDTIDDAVVNLHEAVELYLEEFPMNFCVAPLGTTLNIVEHPKLRISKPEKRKAPEGAFLTEGL